MTDTMDQLYDYFLKYRKVSTDTRRDVTGSIFFALSGTSFNGNVFAADALKKGAALAVVDDASVIPEKASGYYLVENVLDALQKLGKKHREQFDIPVLGITGTNGKTTTKELTAAVLSSEKNILSTQGNLNNHIGVPLTLLGLNETTELAVVEMGANHPGEINTLCQLAQPTHGMITNIGKAHLEGFGSIEGVIRTKNELYDNVRKRKGIVFVHAEDDLLMRLSNGIDRVTYGMNDAAVQGTLLSSIPTLHVEWNHQGKNVDIPTQLFGKYNFSNVMAAVAAGEFFNISPENIRQAIASYVPKNNRSQVIQTKHNTLIMDAYNANPDSMKLAIEDFSGQHASNNTVILGDMFEMGEQAREEHERIVELLSNKSFQQVILVGKEFSKQFVPDGFLCFTTTDEAEAYLRQHPVRDQNVLIKGSRGMALERLIQYL